MKEFLRMYMNKLFSHLLNMLSCDLAIDLGSTNTLIYRSRKGIVINEPSMVAFRRRGSDCHDVVGVGNEAKELIGRHFEDVMVVKPVRHGIIADFNAAGAMLRRYLERAARSWHPASLRVIATVPAQITTADRDVVRNLILSAGAKEVYLMEGPQAAALGAGVDISENHGTMVVDIGGGLTEMSVIVEGDVVSARTIRIGGEYVDRVITEHIQAQYNLVIDGDTAERLKIQMGRAHPCMDGECVTVEGINILTAREDSAQVASHEICEVISEPVNIIVKTIKNFVANLTPEIHVDVIDRGITLAGGGALLPCVDQLLVQELCLPVVVARNPLTCVVLGTGDALNYLPLSRPDGL
ncbi:MAG TPA: rod shape-determining protein [Nitrospirota bacterium]|nr:rod shape-determining protein [Nitrospirota bacterium]